MIKRELKNNFKGFLIWTLIMALLFAVVYFVYPTLIADAEMMNQLLQAMDEKMLALFNMDVIGLDSVFGWVSTEGYLMLILVGGCYFSIMGSNILLKEENDKTIEFLYSKGVTRNKIITSKIVCGIIYVLLFNLIIGVTNYIGLSLSNDLDITKLLLITILPIIGHLFFFLLSIFISTFFTKTNKSIGICLGTLFGLYFISIIADMAEVADFLKYFTPFYYISARDVILNSSINNNVFILVVFSGLITYLTYIIYKKKELV